MTDMLPILPWRSITTLRTARAIFASLLLCTSIVANATLHIVDLGGSQLAFDPQFLTIARGDSIAFINRGGSHNVVADDQSFRCAHGCDNDGQGGSGALSSDNWVAVVEFPKAGSFGYFCEAHGQPGAGMFGRIVVEKDGGSQGPPQSGSAIPSTSRPFEASLLIGMILAALWRLRRRPS